MIYTFIFLICLSGALVNVPFFPNLPNVLSFIMCSIMTIISAVIWKKSRTL